VSALVRENARRETGTEQLPPVTASRASDADGRVARVEQSLPSQRTRAHRGEQGNEGQDLTATRPPARLPMADAPRSL
jgi:hypothetical protein